MYMNPTCVFAFVSFLFSPPFVPKLSNSYHSIIHVATYTDDVKKTPQIEKDEERHQRKAGQKKNRSMGDIPRTAKTKLAIGCKAARQG